VFSISTRSEWVFSIAIGTPSPTTAVAIKIMQNVTTK
jgi:hypothetical protein